MKVLIAEDDDHIREGLREILEEEGYRAVTARDGLETLALFEREKPDFVCLDIMMPGPDGLEVLGRVRRDMNVPVLMLSARGRESDKVEALDAGADDYLTKPFGVEELLA